MAAVARSEAHRSGSADQFSDLVKTCKEMEIARAKRGCDTRFSNESVLTLFEREHEAVFLSQELGQHQIRVRNTAKERRPTAWSCWDFFAYFTKLQQFLLEECQPALAYDAAVLMLQVVRVSKGLGWASVQQGEESGGRAYVLNALNMATNNPHDRPPVAVPLSMAAAQLRDELRCYNCDEVGHRAKDCPKARPRAPGVGAKKMAPFPQEAPPRGSTGGGPGV